MLSVFLMFDVENSESACSRPYLVLIGVRCSGASGCFRLISSLLNGASLCAGPCGSARQNFATKPGRQGVMGKFIMTGSRSGGKTGEAKQQCEAVDR